MHYSGFLIQTISLTSLRYIENRTYCNFECTKQGSGANWCQSTFYLVPQVSFRKEWFYLYQGDRILLESQCEYLPKAAYASSFAVLREREANKTTESTKVGNTALPTTAAPLLSAVD